MLSIIGFIVILGPLVVFHELGHFLFARLFNVKAEIFSVGFGPRIWGRQIGETEWRLSAFPLGGYVKLLGEDPEAPLSPSDRARALPHQKPWKRFFIFLGGPLFNIILAIGIFMVILVIGEPQTASVVGRVEPGSQAEQVGFRAGTRITSVSGVPVKTYQEVLEQLTMYRGGDVEFGVRQANSSGEEIIKVKPSLENGFNEYGEDQEVAKVEGLHPLPRATHVGVSDPKSPAGVAGLKTGDQIQGWGTEKVKTWERIEQLYEATPHKTRVSLEILGADGKTSRVELVKTSGSMSTSWGLHSSELFVEKAVEESPASKIGITKGDHLVQVDDIQLKSFYGLRQAIQKSGEKNGKFKLSWIRDGKKFTQEVNPNVTYERDHRLKQVPVFTVGVMPMLVLAEPEQIIERVLNPFLLVARATERTVSFSWRNLVSIGKMFVGQVSVKTLGGPILIGKIAGESLSRGLITFLTTMAVLSVGLGVLNILPIPVLDGGHLLLLGIEMIRGKPLSLRQMEVLQQVGLSLLLIIMAIVIKNDLMRLTFFN